LEQGTEELIAPEIATVEPAWQVPEIVSADPPEVNGVCEGEVIVVTTGATVSLTQDAVAAEDTKPLSEPVCVTEKG